MSHLRHRCRCFCYCFLFRFFSDYIWIRWRKSVNKDFDISFITWNIFVRQCHIESRGKPTFHVLVAFSVDVDFNSEFKMDFRVVYETENMIFFWCFVLLWASLLLQTTIHNRNGMEWRVLSGAGHTHLSRGLLLHSMVKNHCWIKVTEWSIHVKHTHARTLATLYTLCLYIFFPCSRVFLVHSWFGCARTAAGAGAAVFAAVSRN